MAIDMSKYASVLYANQNSSPDQMDDSMYRPDGSIKSMKGYLGAIERPDGTVSTEISAGFEIDGKEMDIPLMVPGLTKEEIDYLITTDIQGEDFFKNMPKSIVDKAIDHAEKRIKEGKNVFYQDGEENQ
jgi:hypothetical protein